MKLATRDALWATGAAVAITGLITWREIRRTRDRAGTRASEPARSRGEYR